MTSRTEELKQPIPLSVCGDIISSRRVLKTLTSPADIANVPKNTAARHTHNNKTQIDLITDGLHDQRTDNPHAVTKYDVGLGNIAADADHTGSNTAKDILNQGDLATQDRADLFYTDGADVTANNKSADSDKFNGLTSTAFVILDNNGLVPTIQLPSYVDDVLEYDNLASFPATGEAGKIYVAKDTNKTYRWSGAIYIYITSGAVDSVNGKTGVVSLGQNDIGLDQVDNTSDNDKPISSNTQTALDAKLNSSFYTASDILNKIKTVDGENSGLDADTLDGNEATAFATAAQGVKADNALPAADNAAGIVDQGTLATKNSVDLATTEVTNKSLANLDPSANLAVQANTAKVGITTTEQTDISSNSAHRTTTSGNPHDVTKTDIGLGNVANTDLTPSVNSNSAHRVTISGNPHNVTKADIGLGNVADYDVLPNDTGKFLNGQGHWSAASSGSGLWSDNNSYITPNNTTDFHIKDDGTVTIGTTDSDISPPTYYNHINLLSKNNAGGAGVVGWSHSSPLGYSDAMGTIGISGIGLNDNTLREYVYGGYFEGIKNANAHTQGSAQGIEIAIKNLHNSAYDVTAMGGFSNGSTMALWLSSGSPGSVSTNYDASVAIGILKVAARFRRGIVIINDSIADIGYGYPIAIEMADGYGINWGTPTSYLTFKTSKSSLMFKGGHFTIDNNASYMALDTAGNQKIGLNLDGSNGWHLGAGGWLVSIGAGSTDNNPILIRVNGTDNKQIIMSPDTDSAGKHYLTIN